MFSIARHFEKPRYKCDDLINAMRQRPRYYTLVDMELRYTSSTGSHTIRGPLDEYKSFALRTIVRNEALRPYIIDGQLRFASEHYVLDEEPPFSLPACTNPGRDYTSLFIQRLLCLAISGLSNPPTDSAIDPHFHVLQHIFDLNNPESVEAYLTSRADDSDEDAEEGDALEDAGRGEMLADSKSLRLARAQLARFQYLRRAANEIKHVQKRMDLTYVLQCAPSLQVPITAQIRCLHHDDTCTCLEIGVQNPLFDAQVKKVSEMMPIPTDLLVRPNLYYHITDMLPPGPQRTPCRFAETIYVTMKLPPAYATPCSTCEERSFYYSGGNTAASGCNYWSDCVACCAKFRLKGWRIAILLSARDGVYCGEWFYPETVLSQRASRIRTDKFTRTKIPSPQ